MVAVFSMTEEIVETAVSDPLTMIASDGILNNVLVNGVVIVDNGELQTGAYPGRAVRALFK